MKNLGVVLAAVLTICGFATAATLPGTVDMTRSVAGLGEVSPGTLGFSVTLTITAAPDIAPAVTALAVEENVPAGWAYMGVSGSPMPMERLDGSLLQLFWIDTPDMSAPVVLEYYLEAPAAQADATITGKVLYRTNSGPLESPEVVTLPNEINCLFLTRSSSLPGYVPGAQLTFTVTVNSFCLEAVTALAVVEVCPAGWTFVSATGVADNGGLEPSPGAEGPFEFVWLSPIPGFPYTFTYTVAVPESQEGAAVVSGQAISRLSGPELRSPMVDTSLDYIDTVAPVIVLNGGSPVTVECGGVYTELGATATDNVDPVVNVIVDNSAVNTSSPGSYTVYYDAADSAGNASQETRTVVVEDTTAPTVVIDGGTTQAGACGVPLTLNTATASDVCQGSVAATVFDLGGLNPADPAVGVYFVVYEAVDSAANRGTATLTVTVTDTAMPLLTLNGANPLTVECGTAFTDPGATATDTCAGNLTPVIVTEGAVDTAVPGLYVLTYTVEDPSGNTASLARDVQVVDTTPPMISLLGPSTMTLTLGTAYTEPGYSASDTCAGDLTGGVSVTGTVNSNALGTYVLTYSVSDGEGNSAETTRTVTVILGAAPEITILGENPATVECGGTYEDAGATASDAEDGDLTPYILVDNPVDASVPGVYLVSYEVTDADLNTTTAQRTVVVQDVTAPVLTLLGDNPLVVQCGGALTDPGAAAMDACQGNLDAAISVYSNVDMGSAGLYDMQYVVRDASGNESSETRYVEVVDTVAPIILLLGGNPMVLECGAPFVEPGVIGSDACDGTVEVVSSESSVNFGAVGQVTVTYTAQDGAGNTAEAVRTVNIVDTTPPALTLLGASPMVVPQGTPYEEPGYSAADLCAGDVSAGVVVTGTVNTAVPGDYPLTYTADDGAGNSSEAVRVVRVTPGTPPVLVLLGDNPMTVECGAGFADPGATASDAEDGDLTGQITVEGTVNFLEPGLYVLQYGVSDSDGNTVTDSRSVFVSDTTPPQLTLTGPAQLTIPVGGPYVEPGFTAFDACAGDLTQSVVVSGSVDTSTPGTYVLLYMVYDNAANPATVERSVLVAAGTPPVITVLGANPLTVECGGVFQDPGATASDAQDGDLTADIVVGGTVDTAVPGLYLLSYAVADSDGLAALETRSVQVADTAAPVVALLGANPATVAVGGEFSEPGYTAADTCAGDLTASVTVTGTVDTSVPGTYSLVYSVQDPAGNAGSATRTVVVGGTGYCVLTDVDILRPTGNVLTPLVTSTAAVPLRSRPVFSSADCVTGTVSVEYFINGVSRGASTDAAADYPLSVPLGVGQYELTVVATQQETGAVVTASRVFRVIGAQINRYGYLDNPFPSLPMEGDLFENTLAVTGYYRVIAMASAYCEEEVGLTADIVLTAEYPENPGQSVTVRVPRGAIPCGYQAIVILTLSDSIEGLVGYDQAPVIAPTPDGLVAGGLFFDVSIIIASQADVLAGGEIPCAELDNAWLADNPVSFTLNRLSFTPGRVPVFLSHPTDIQPVGDADVNLFASEGAWTDDSTGGFMVQGDALTGSATALSVFAPFERRATLDFSPDIAYGVVFGRAVLEKTLTRTFTVTNVGDLPVTGEALIAGDEAFTVSGESAYTLQPGQSAEITVAFTPAEIRDYEAQLQLTGDPEGLHSARLLGTGTKGRTNLFGCGPGGAAGGGDWAVLLAVCALLALGSGLRGAAGRAR
ncbi:MAG TPA: DUF5011 domain-containing protein [Candidatus Hydrogenedentes bacterium]|nr:DUF5011 domain-containing protein [Candidatus Hydrogenedentota bacterium]